MIDLQNQYNTRYNIGNETEGSERKLTLQQQVKAACDVAEMSLTELGNKMGMSQQNFSKRLKVGKFTKEELEEMAKHLGCEYISIFKFSDGSII